MKLCTIVGARPQFVKAAVVSRALAHIGIREVLVHTGQHYDQALSQVFFEELGLPRPAVNLNVGSGTHAVQTGEMMMRLEQFLLNNPVDCLLVYGDTNSTLAATLVAAKMQIPLAHVEAGLRSFNRSMPEEINRIVADRLSSLLFCPTETAVTNLKHEGITEGVYLTGDVMLDATRTFSEHAERFAPLHGITNHSAKTYYAATVHRVENTDDPERLAGIFEGLGRLDRPVVMPLHPRTRARLKISEVAPNITLLDPISYLEMLTLVREARCVLTDSGGLQKEALWLGVPCVTLRDETEWTETLERGWNQLVGTDPDTIMQAVSYSPTEPPPTLGEGPGDQSPSKIIAHILSESHL